MSVLPKIVIEPKLVRIDAFDVVAIEVRVPATELPRAVRAARVHLLEALQNLDHPVDELVCGGPCSDLDLPASVPHQYLVGVDSNLAELPGRLFKTRHIPSRKYAEFHYVGPSRDAWKVYVGANEWARDNRVHYDKSAYYIERYPASHDWEDRENPHNEIVIQLPIAE